MSNQVPVKEMSKVRPVHKSRHLLATNSQLRQELNSLLTKQDVRLYQLLKNCAKRTCTTNKWRWFRVLTSLELSLGQVSQWLVGGGGKGGGGETARLDLARLIVVECNFGLWTADSIKFLMALVEGKFWHGSNQKVDANFCNVERRFCGCEQRVATLWFN